MTVVTSVMVAVLAGGAAMELIQGAPLPAEAAPGMGIVPTSCEPSSPEHRFWMTTMYLLTTCEYEIHCALLRTCTYALGCVGAGPASSVALDCAEDVTDAGTDDGVVGELVIVPVEPPAALLSPGRVVGLGVLVIVPELTAVPVPEPSGVVLLPIGKGAEVAAGLSVLVARDVLSVRVVGAVLSVLVAGDVLFELTAGTVVFELTAGAVELEPPLGVAVGDGLLVGAGVLEGLVDEAHWALGTTEVAGEPPMTPTMELYVSTGTVWGLTQPRGDGRRSFWNQKLIQSRRADGLDRGPVE